MNIWPAGPLSRIASLAFLLPVAMLSACTGPPRSEGPNGPFVLAEPENPAELSSAELRLERGVAVYTDPDDQTVGGLRIAREPNTGDGRAVSWTLTRERARSGDFSQTKRQLFRRSGAGGVELVEEINKAEGVEVVFEPALVSLPSVLSTGSPHEQSFEMIVHPLGDRSAVKARGKATNTITMVERGMMQTPIGAVRVYHVRSELSAELGPASITNTTDQYFRVPDDSGEAGGGGGFPSLVAEHRREKTTTLGLFTRERQERWVVAERVSSVE